ncbi:MAG TPA: C4-dicarboxylate ABC transporter substrate-binding protein [Lachnospiraceae bacterium]|nr:C4-dicarboxylate ABC transporter substrate-binding protein [Lachnospiraceae bacterium]
MKKKTMRLFCCVSLIISMLSFTGCGGQRLMMGTGGTSGTYYAFGGVLAQYMTDNTDYRITAVSTAASKANIQSIGDGDYQIGFTQSDVMNYAWDGSRSFETDGPCRDFRVLGALYAETVQLITMKKDIKSVSDLKGKSVSIGAPGSGVYFNAMDVLEGAGLTVDDIKPQYQSFDDSKEALKDGQIDAAFIVAGAPTSAITELATTNGVFLIPIEGKLRDDIMGLCPYYAPLEIPANTYPGQNDPIETITIKATLIVDAKLDDDMVYDLTAAIFDHTEEISKENAKGEELSIENATSGITIPFHIGAARYFEEHGVPVAAQE